MKAVETFFTSVRTFGDRVTGGGLRAIGRRWLGFAVRHWRAFVSRRPIFGRIVSWILRPLPGVEGFLSKLIDNLDPYTALPPYIPRNRLATYRDDVAVTLPVTARLYYLKLKAAMDDQRTRSE